MNKLIIHISGASGSGKTTLGNILKQQFKNEIVVKDINDLKEDYMKQGYKLMSKENIFKNISNILQY
jgi:uridine kinase